MKTPKKTHITTPAPDPIDTWRAARTAAAEAERAYALHHPFLRPNGGDLLTHAREREAFVAKLEAEDALATADVAATMAVLEHEIATGDELAKLADPRAIRAAVTRFDAREAELEAARVALRAERRADADRRRAAFEALSARRAADDLPAPIYVPTFDTVAAYREALDKYLREPRPTKDRSAAIRNARRDAAQARASHELALQEAERARTSLEADTQSEAEAHRAAMAARAREHLEQQASYEEREREIARLAAASVAREKGVA